MAVRNGQRAAARRAARGRGVRAMLVDGPGLVDEHQPVRIEIELALEPVLAPLQDVGAVLLGGVRRLFLRVIPWRAKKRRSVP